MIFIVPALIPAMALALGLDYLRRQLLPSVPTTSPVSEPYTPPFTGGQCAIPYTVKIMVTDKQTNVESVFDTRGVNGAITGAEVFDDVPNNVLRLTITSSSAPLVKFANKNFYKNLRLGEIIPQGGALDNCGNLPNPNGAPIISQDGLADSPAIETDDDSPVVQGAPIVPYNPITAALAALLAALKLASDVKDAIDFLGDMLKKIGESIDGIKDWLDDKEKNPDSGKDVKRHDYGSIRKDGFLRLYPDGSVSGFKPDYLDLQLLSIPIGYGKYFGNLSPNFYRFRSLGYISFVSPTFGNLETVEIEFSRKSINVPPNAYGFFYHLGLEDIIRANVSIFYLVDKE